MARALRVEHIAISGQVAQRRAYSISQKQYGTIFSTANFMLFVAAFLRAFLVQFWLRLSVATSLMWRKNVTSSTMGGYRTFSRGGEQTYSPLPLPGISWRQHHESLFRTLGLIIVQKVRATLCSHLVPHRTH